MTMMLVGIILAILTPIVAKLIQLAISRKREFLADASGALLTRYPGRIGFSVGKISRSLVPLKRANNATAHLYISSPLRGAVGRIFGKIIYDSSAGGGKDSYFERAENVRLFISSLYFFVVFLP